MATSDTDSVPYETLKPADIEHLLGKPLFSRDLYQGNKYAGVVTGLAWTAVGGEILFIETSVSRCKGGKLTLTGNLGDVMKESAVLALEYIKAHAETLHIDYRVFDHWGVHIHVPEGATPKDGPSAGITIATSIASALTQRRVRDHIAMTGEITLRGRVLPVGGIRRRFWLLNEQASRIFSFQKRIARTWRKSMLAMSKDCSSISLPTYRMYFALPCSMRKWNTPLTWRSL